jgi:hypothetical protein
MLLKGKSLDLSGIIVIFYSQTHNTVPSSMVNAKDTVCAM